MSKFMKSIVSIFLISNMIMIPINAEAETHYSNWNDISNYIYTQLNQREENISFVFSGDKNNFSQNISEAITNAYSKDDYLERSWIEIIPKASATQDGIKTEIKISYLTSKTEEQFIEEELKKIINLIIKDDMTEYQKVRAINDYLVERYEYDYTLKSSSAYSALSTNHAICQGYSMTAYKLFKYANIESKIVIGTSGNQSHSWNIVKINNCWYHLDITNNDSTSSDKYFLKSDDWLKSNNYKWDSSNYPAALKNYI